jgi:ribonuclease VapC
VFIDASAVVAIIKREPGFEGLLQQAQQSVTALIYSPLSRFEAVVSLARNRPETNRSATPDQITVAGQLVDRLYLQLDATCIDLTEPIGSGALIAAQTYGRAVGHAAGLNLGDCFAYACAKERRVGLLYKGDDFARTDLG